MSPVRTRKHLLLVVLAITLPLLASPAHASEIVEHPELETLFDRHGVEGAFVLLDADKDRLHVVNPGRVGKRRYPASTFKIANSLIALENGAVVDENEIIPYGGRPQPLKSWERDMSMRDAIRISNVPVYQELARRIGLEAYAKWLDRLEYGNRMTGKNVERFWLEGPLSISPLEQVKFVAKLARGELDASDRSQSKVRDILLVEADDHRRLFAKSGWSVAATPQIGWWVGWVERNGRIYAFALTIDIDMRSDADKRRPLGKDLLSAIGVYD